MPFPNFALMDSRQMADYFADAQQSLSFVMPQQLRIEAEVYQIQYPAFDYAGLMYVNTDGDMWDAGSIFFSGDIAGKAEFLSSRAFDVPYADVALEAFERGNHMAGIGYEWSLGELVRAARFGRNLTTQKAEAARRVADQFIYNIAMTGSAEKTWLGLINNTAVPTASVGAAWGAATAPEVILGDINNTILAPGLATRGLYQSEQLLVPPTMISYLAGRLLPNTNTTLLSFVTTQNVLAQTGGNFTMTAVPDLETAGAGGTRRMVANSKDRNVVQFHLPGPHTFLSPWQRSSMSWEVAGIMNLGGTEFRIPAGARYTDAF